MFMVMGTNAVFGNLSDPEGYGTPTGYANKGVYGTEGNRDGYSVTDAECYGRPTGYANKGVYGTEGNRDGYSETMYR